MSPDSFTQNGEKTKGIHKGRDKSPSWRKGGKARGERDYILWCKETKAGEEVSWRAPKTRRGRRGEA